jgi:hypothetical protein
MGIIARATLPSEFFDRTSAFMLKQPEPQYLYAQMVFAANAQAELRRAEALGISPERAIASMGASVPALQEMQRIIAAPQAEAIFVTDELAPGKVGHTIRMNRPVFSGGGYTEAARTIASSQTISTTPIDVSAEQVSITVRRVAGPYASNGSGVQPYAVDRLDSERAMHSIAGVVGLQLSRDRMKYMDSVFGTLFDDGANVLYPQDPTNALSTDASAFVVQGDRPFDYDVVTRTERKLLELNIPAFANGRYMMIVSAAQAQQLRTDPQYGRLAVFMADKNPLNGYVATVGAIDIYQSTTNPSDSSTVSGVTIFHACCFGPGAVGYANAGPCRVASSTDDNYGETAKVVWLAYEGQSILDNRFIVNVHSD